jgi:hypothetical protein
VANLGLVLAEHVNSNPSLHQTPRISCGKRTGNNRLLNKNAASIKETAAKHNGFGKQQKLEKALHWLFTTQEQLKNW